MKSTLKAFLLALALHAAILLFGGLLLFHKSDDEKKTREVDLVTAATEKKEEEKKKPEEEKKAEEQPAEDADLADVQAAAPDLSQLSQLEAPVVPQLAAMSLSDLESALNPDLDAGAGFAMGGSSLASGGRIGGTGAPGAGLDLAGDVDSVASVADLDQRPRAVFQTPPNYPQELRKKGVQGTVEVVFLVDTSGRVISPKVDKSTDPAFERPALEAVRQWRFEAGTRAGQKVSFKMRVPITFKAG